MRALSAAVTVGLAAWCSLGALGLIGSPSVSARIALLPPWWLLPFLIVGVFLILRRLRLSSAQLSPLFGSTVAILPWLPVPLPPAALLWTGPFVLAVWIAVILGTFIARVPPVRSRWLTDARRAPLAGAMLAFALYGGSAWWLSPILPDGDAPHYLIIAQSLIRDGDLRIENNHQRGDYLEYSLHTARPHYLRRGVNGAIYSIHAPGLPAVIAPAMFVFGYPGAVVFLGLIGALGTALVWHLGYRTTGGSGAAWFGWASCALTVPFFFQATQIFPDGLAATCVLLGARPLITAEAETGSPGWGPSDRMWLLSGIALAILPWLQTRLALIAAATAVCLCFRIRSVRRLAIFVAVPVVSAAVWFGYFYIVYGTLDPAAPYGPYTQTSFANLQRGFPGLLFDQQFGLIPNAPVYGFVLAGVMAAAVRGRRWSWELLIVFVSYTVGVGMYQIWWGGTSAPARLLTPLTFLFGIAAARIWNEAKSPATRSMGCVALVASVVVTGALVFPDRGRLLFNFRDGFALWLEWSHDLLDLPRGMPSLFRDTPGQAWLKAAVWGGSFAAAWLALRAMSGRKTAQPGGAPWPFLSWPTIWGLAGALMIALTLVWQIDRVQPLTPGTAELGLLRQASRHRPLAYDYGEARFTTASVALAPVRVRTDRLRRPVPPPAPLLSVSDVPAGTYRLHVVSSGTPDGNLVLRIGATPLPAWSASISGARAHLVGPLIHLPADVQSLVVEGDDRARSTVTAVELEPVGPDRFANRPLVAMRDLARRAVRYETADAYFMDDNAYPEPSGFWVAGGRAARVLIADQGAPLRLFLRNAPVDSTVTIDIDDERHQLALRPGEERTIELHRTKSGSEARLRIHAPFGFRPSQADPANADLRYLGCWVEIR